jgi:hypothetical protein
MSERRTPANLAIHIERVVVDIRDGVPADLLRIHAAIEAELTRLFSRPHIALESRIERSLSSTADTVGQHRSAAGIGEEIARQIHRVVTGER